MDTILRLDRVLANLLSWIADQGLTVVTRTERSPRSGPDTGVRVSTRQVISPPGPRFLHAGCARPTRPESSGQRSAPVQWLFRNGYHEHRSPDLLVMLKPGCLVLPTRVAPLTVRRMSTTGTYHCPLLLHGPGIKHGQSSDPVGPEDVALTLAHLLGLERFTTEPESRPLIGAPRPA